MCTRLKPPTLALIGDDPSTLQSLGYFSVFYLRFDQENHPGMPVMTLEVRNSRGHFQHAGGERFVPLGKTPLGIIPR